MDFISNKNALHYAYRALNIEQTLKRNTKTKQKESLSYSIGYHEAIMKEDTKRYKQERRFFK